MATQNNKRILDLGFRFHVSKSKQNRNRNKLHGRNSQTIQKNYRKSQTRAVYNIMFYGY